MQSGADNNPAMNYFKEDTRSYDCADACAFQYGELKNLTIGTVDGEEITNLEGLANLKQISNT